MRLAVIVSICFVALMLFSATAMAQPVEDQYVDLVTDQQLPTSIVDPGRQDLPSTGSSIALLMLIGSAACGIGAGRHLLKRSG